MTILDAHGQKSGPQGSVHGFSVSVLGCVIRFEAQSRAALDLLDRHLFPSVSRESGQQTVADIRVRIVEAEGGTEVVVEDAVIASANQPSALLRQLIDWLDRSLVQRLNGLHAVHAGAVLIGDRALVVPGASHSGKSSLVAELLRRGAVCLSDEYALIDAEGRVHAYPRVLLLRDGAVSQRPVAPADLDARVATAPARVGWILALKFDRSASWSIQPIAQSAALLTLLQNTPHVLAERPAMVSAFQKAVEGAACYSGLRGESADAVAHILELVSSAP